MPAERLEAERPLLRPLPSLRPSFGRAAIRKVDRLSCVRFGSARYSVPTKLIGRLVEVQASGHEVKVSPFGEVVATHALAAPGEASVDDEHYGGARRGPERRPRPKSPAEKAICALGNVGEAFIKAAAAAGVTKLSSELADIAALGGWCRTGVRLMGVGRLRVTPDPERPIPGRSLWRRVRRSAPHTRLKRLRGASRAVTGSCSRSGHRPSARGGAKPEHGQAGQVGGRGK